MKFKRAGAGTSKDTVEDHFKFRDKYSLKVSLISDKDGSLYPDYGLWTKKMNCARAYMRIERSTFLIDRKGNVGETWPRFA